MLGTVFLKERNFLSGAIAMMAAEELLSKQTYKIANWFGAAL